MESQERMKLLNKHIFIVNGRPGAGKTSFEDLILERVQGARYSIIDPVKNLLINEGIWNGRDKSESIRKLMSDVKIALDEYCDYSYNEVRKFVEDFKANKIPGNVLFIDMREEKDISRAVVEFGADSIYIQNDNARSVHTNIADDFSDDKNNYPYDIIVYNSGSYGNFIKTCKRFANILINVGGCRERV